jgi:hypothetical protein
MCFGAFIVEDKESRQADIRDFFLTESNYRRGVLRCIACRINGCPVVPPASDKIPATPNTVTALFRPLRFEAGFARDMVRPPIGSPAICKQ